MLHSGDIKISHNNNLAVMPQQLQGVKTAHDSAPDAGFLAILKSQVLQTEQNSSMAAERPEPMRPNTPLQSEDKAPREAANQNIHKEETAQAVGRAEEQTQKTAAQIQGKDAKSAEAKNTAEKKPAPEQQGAAIEKETDTGARIKQKQKQKKSGETELLELHESLHRMIDFLKGKEQHDIRPVKAAIQELHDLLRTSKQNPDRGLLKKSADRLAEAIGSFAGKAHTGKHEHLAGSMAGMKELLKKVKTGGDDKNQNRRQEPLESIAPAAKDLLAKMESLLAGVKGDGAHQRSDSNDQGTGMLFTEGAMKSAASPRRSDAATQSMNTSFRENLENIIQNARVVVRDSRNGSFSVRLHPEELGTVNISLSLHEGVVRGSFLVETQEAKDMLTGNLDYIKQQLSDAGIAVGEFQVNVNSQREQLLQNRDGEQFVYLAPAKQSVEMESSFASQAQVLHDGRINLVI